MQTQRVQLIADRYLVQERIAHEGAVELYHALDRQLQRLVLLQVLSERGARDQTLNRQFFIHQSVAATIHNPLVSGVYDAGVSDGRPFSVMEKQTGRTPDALYRESGAAPDVASALRITRQVAEALQFCRDAGLGDWAFSYCAVRVEDDGKARLALIEGLDQSEGVDRRYTATSPADDPRALGALLRVMLVGTPDPRITRVALSSLPLPVLSLLDTLYLQRGGDITSAGEVARTIAALESSLAAPTQAYVVSESAGEAVAGSIVDAAAIPAHDQPTLDLSQQPTMPASVQPAAALVDARPPTPSRPYNPAFVAAPAVRSEPRRWPWILSALGLLLLVALLALFVPRFVGQPTPVQGAVQMPTTEATPTPLPLIAMPDLLGKSLADADNAASMAGLQLVQADPIRHDTFVPETVARQEPGPGEQVQLGSVITVSLSLGPEPAPPTAAPPPQTDPPQADQPPPRGKKGEKKKKGNDEDDD